MWKVVLWLRSSKIQTKNSKSQTRPHQNKNMSMISILSHQHLRFRNSPEPLRSYFVKVEPKEENGSKVRLRLCPKERQKSGSQTVGGRFVSLFSPGSVKIKAGIKPSDKKILLWLFMTLVYRYTGIRLLASSYSL